MSDSAERKIKLLLLYEILLKQTDELHPMTTSDIFTALQDSGIAVSRQTLYEDIEVLNRYGFEVICLKGKENQYYISSRSFERPEAEILLKAVCSSNFLSKKKKYELLNKVAELFGGSAQEIIESTATDCGTGGKNEHIYYTIDALMTALMGKRQVSFRYFDYGAKGEKVYRKSGGRYRANPLGFAYSDGKFYFFCYHDNYIEDGPTKYIVERMDDIAVEQEKITDSEIYKHFDLSEYKKELFSMYSGERREVTLIFPQELLNVAYERFGRDIEPELCGEKNYRITVPVQVSKTFFGWLASFGGAVRLYAPKDVRGRYEEFIKGLIQSMENS